MEVKEHFYADDPSRGPADAKTTLRDVDYFFLGNGRIQAAVQIAPAGDGTAVGLLIMDPERLGPKRAALSFDQGSGIAATAVTLMDGRAARTARPGAVRAMWLRSSADPRVRVLWRSGPYSVEEIFFCPDMRTGRLLRQVTVTRPAAGPSACRLSTGLPGRTIETRLRFRGRAASPIHFEYRLTGRPDRVAAHIRLSPGPAGETESAAHWKTTADCRFHDPLLDHLFTASKSQLRAAVSASGRMDGGIWQYNLEWVRDQAFAAMALAMSGEPGPARTILARLLADFISDEGAPVDSSRLRPPAESELDQNGILLVALESYLQWTGDEDLIRSNWDRIVKVAGFPLRPEFRHAASGLLVNRREFWERHGAHGIRPGLELAQQLFVAMGLRSAGRLAAAVGRTREAHDWAEAAMSLRRAMLKDPRYSLIEDGAFIKRRGLDGEVQRHIRPEPGSELPPGTPLFGRGRHWIDPDTSAALPVAWEFVDPAGRLAAKTLASMETLWNQRWKGGGYGRYHVTSEPDSPGPWPFASLFVARAAIEAGRPAAARRVLDWLGRVPGSRAGSWFEFYGPRPVPPYPQVGIIPWTWAEIIFFFIHHQLGVRPGERFLSLRPRLLPGLDRMEADLPIRGGRVELEVRRARRGEEPGFKVAARNARKVPYHHYGLGIELRPKFGRVAVRAVIPEKGRP